MRVNLRRSLWIGGTVSLLLIILISGTSFVMYKRQSQMAKMVSHTYEVLNKIKDVRNVIVDLQTSRRGYRSTNDTSLLSLYHTRKDDLHIYESDLEALVSDNPNQVANVTRLREGIQSMIEYWSSLPTYDDNFPITEKLRITHKENILMFEVNTAIDSLVNRERRMLDARTSANRDMIDLVMILLVVGIAVTLLIVVIMIMVIRKAFERRHQYQQYLKHNNNALHNALQEKEQINIQLERFTYVVAHDLKSPIAGSMAVVNFLAEDERVNAHDDLRELTSIFYDTMHKLNERIASVLEYSRSSGKQQKTEQVDVRRLVNNIKEILFAPKNIHIKIAEDLPVVTGNEAKLQQIFQNLMSNAVKYNDKREGLIEIGVKENAAYYEFFVKDNGPGIKEADRERIFSLYEITDNEAHGETGTGIGLNLLKTLVEEHGGRLWVEGEEGAGSVFYFTWRK